MAILENNLKTMPDEPRRLTNSIKFSSNEMRKTKLL
jgi:hypothetical protein